MIGTPAYDGTVNVVFADSLMNTIKLSAQYGIDILPVYMPYDALIQRSRNDLVRLALEGGVDDLIFIDSDQAWNPEWVFRLLSHPVDVVGAAVVKKSDLEQYNVRANTLPVLRALFATSLLVVDGVGTGFMRISRKALVDLWNASPEYDDNGKACRMVFDVQIVDGKLVSEDNVVCNKLKSLGYPIFVDETMTCSHVGSKQWYGDFSAYLSRVELER